jgi:hypothetical protein
MQTKKVSQLEEPVLKYLSPKIPFKNKFLIRKYKLQNHKEDYLCIPSKYILN